MPASAKLALAALLAASILRAFYGAPPRSPHRAASLGIGMLGGACYGIAMAVAWAQHATRASMLLVVAIETMCFAVWLARGRDDRGDGGPEPEPDPPVDWAEFDRERERWGRSPILH
jgi:hypothetical protein